MDVVVVFRCTPGQREAIHRVAALKGQDTSTMLREMAMREVWKGLDPRTADALLGGPERPRVVAASSRG